MSEELENNNLLARWLNDDLSEQERDLLAKEKGIDELESVLNDIDTWTLPKIDIEASLIKAKKVTPPLTKTIFLTRPSFLRVAAAILLLAIGYFTASYFSSQDLVSISTGIAEHKTHVLPDGSSITLGPVSSIEYDTDSWSKKREVSLVGQGFFDVKKGSDFSVKTDLSVVSVLGTQFDIDEKGDKIYVNCFEGKVQVEINNAIEILNAREGLLHEKNSFTRKMLKDTAPSWLNGFSSFSEQRLSDVIDEFNRYFDINLKVPNKYINTEFTGGFAHDDVELALQSIFTPLEIPYSLSEDGKVVFK